MFAIQLAFSCLAFLWTAAYLWPYVLRSHTPAGCKKIGWIGPSRCEDEYDPRYSETMKNDGKTAWTIKSLFIYPVKSCKGVELDTADVTGVGMDYDRQFSFAHYTNISTGSVGNFGWKFVTQREIPALSKVQVDVWIPDPTCRQYKTNLSTVKSAGVLVLKWPGYSEGSPWYYKLWRKLTCSSEMSVQIPYAPTKEQIRSYGYTAQNMIIWKETAKATLIAYTESWRAAIGRDRWIVDLRRFLEDESHYQNGRFSFNMNRPFALFRVGDSDLREVYRNAPRKEEIGYQSTIGFQDAYPLHILGLASVQDLTMKQAIGSPRLSIHRFRANIIVNGGEAYAEDAWKRVAIGGIEYYVACRTTRCLMPNVDPINGRRHPSEPNRTLKQDRNIDAGAPKSGCLGMQMVPASAHRKSIRVGDRLEILETGEHLYIKQ